MVEDVNALQVLVVNRHTAASTTTPPCPSRSRDHSTLPFAEIPQQTTSTTRS
jgi:hypothetical protein